MSRRQWLVVNDDIAVPHAELQFTYVRSSGPGGQNVNKLNTKAVLRWNVSATPSLPDDVQRRFLARYQTRINDQGELVLASQRHRDQRRNMEDCLGKLRDLIAAVAEPPPVRRRTRRPRAGNEARLRKKQNNAAKKRLRRPPKRGEE